MSSSLSLLSRIWRAAREELEPVLSRHVFAQLTVTLPGSGLSRIRTAALRASGVKIGAHSLVHGTLRVTGSGNPYELLSIGDDAFLTGGLHVDAGAPVRIGNGVCIGHDVSLLTITHTVGPVDMRCGGSVFREIVIEDGCWLASRCTVLPGVTIGTGSIVAAGSVVTRDVPPHTLVAGVPARVIRELPAVDATPPSMRYDARQPAER